MGSTKRLLVLAVCLSALVACSSDGDEPSATSASGDAAASTGASPSGSSGQTSPGDGSSDDASDGEGGGDSGEGQGGSSGDPSASGSRQPDEGEALPSPDTSSGLPGLSPPDLDPLVPTPLPDAASKRGGVVAGYPKALGPAPQSKVDVTSVSPGDDTLQVALTATSKRRPGGVLRFYRIKLAKYGFVERPAKAVGGSEAAAFRRKKSKDAVTITVTRKGSRTDYSVFGTLHAG